MKLESPVFAYIKYSLCPKKLNVMDKGKNWGFLQKFEIYRNVELLHQLHIDIGDGSTI